MTDNELPNQLEQGFEYAKEGYIYLKNNDLTKPLSKAYKSIISFFNRIFPKKNIEKALNDSSSNIEDFKKEALIILKQNKNMEKQLKDLKSKIEKLKKTQKKPKIKYNIEGSIKPTIIDKNKGDIYIS